jgi:ketosteroid isomerase-like protein
MDHPNIDLVRGLYGAFMAGDAERLRAAFAPDVRLDVSGFDRTAGSYDGVDAVLGYFFADDHMDDYGLEVVDMLVSDERVAVIAKSSGRRGDRTIVNDFVQVIRLVDGKVVKIRNYSWDQRAVAAFMSEAA